MKISLLINHAHTKQYGFTFIEMIMVIVIISILGVGSVQFISFSAQGYVDTVRRSELASTAAIVNEKITRLIRDALPNSVRITANARCIEFIPIISASRYVRAPFQGSPATVSRDSVHMVPVDGLLNYGGFLAIYPMPNQLASLYSNGDNPGYLSLEKAQFSGVNSGASVYTFENSGSFEFLQPSNNQRVFITDSPRSFCQIGTGLFYYRNYSFISDINDLVDNLPTALPNRLLIADKLSPDSLIFKYQPSSLRRNAIVAYELTLQDTSRASEVLVVNQEVQVRNVP